MKVEAAFPVILWIRLGGLDLAPGLKQDFCRKKDDFAKKCSKMREKIQNYAK